MKNSLLTALLQTISNISNTSSALQIHPRWSKIGFVGVGTSAAGTIASRSIAHTGGVTVGVAGAGQGSSGTRLIGRTAGGAQEVGGMSRDTTLTTRDPTTTRDGSLQCIQMLSSSQNRVFQHQAFHRVFNSSPV